MNASTSREKRKSIATRSPETPKKLKLRIEHLPPLSNDEIYVPDCIARNLDVVFTGFNPGVHSAFHRHHYAGPTNHFWPLLYESRIVPEPLTFKDDQRCPRDFGIGFLNVVDRPTHGSDGLTTNDYAEGRKRLLMKLRKFKPKLVCFVGYGVFKEFVRGTEWGQQVSKAKWPVAELIELQDHNEQWNLHCIVVASTSPRPVISRKEKLFQFQQTRRDVEPKNPEELQSQWDSASEAEWHIPAQQEYRFEVGWGQKITLEVKQGTAEIMGAELALNVVYTFQGGSKLAVYSWHGCRLRVVGKLEVDYLASETPMPSYLNFHMALENKRQTLSTTADTLLDEEPRITGPRVLLVGGQDVGKTYLAKTLISYALKCGHHPLYVDLDPNEGTIAVPTTVGALVIDRLEVEETTGIPLTAKPPLLYSFGHLKADENLVIYERIVNKLGHMCLQRLQADSHVDKSGMIVDTPSWSDGLNADMVVRIVEAFGIDIVVVVGNERIYSELSKVLFDQGRTTSILQLSKSGGVVEKDALYRKYMMMKRIREYFYGTPKLELVPYSSTVPFQDLAVRRVGEVKMAPDSALPIGADRQLHGSGVVKIENYSVLLNTILAVSNADHQATWTEEDEDQLVETNIAGFIYVSAVDDKRKRLTILAPNPGKLPKRFMWLGILRWAEV